MRNAQKITRKQAWPLVKAVFPEYKGRKFSIVASETVTFYDLNWGGGSRNVYRFVSDSGDIIGLPVATPWLEPNEGRTVRLTPDILVIEHSIFCGKDLGIAIYTHPSNMPRLLQS